MSRRKTDGERIAQRMAENWAIHGAHIEATAQEIDRLIRKRMAEAWGEGWFASNWDRKRVHENPYRGRTKK
jgi:hypothetical protein